MEKRIRRRLQILWAHPVVGPWLKAHAIPWAWDRILAVVLGMPRDHLEEDASLSIRKARKLWSDYSRVASLLTPSEREKVRRTIQKFILENS